MLVFNILNIIVLFLFLVCYSYKLIFFVVPFFKESKKFPKGKDNRFAVIIAARNEKNVIAHLLDSIKNQTYQKELIETFVIADNCTDNTAEIARQHGAVVYERSNKFQIGKGYALEFLFEKINEDYGWGSFDGFFIIDADNLLDENFINAMNDTFSNGYEIVTSYRNTKNFDNNWISAGNSIWFLREATYLNNVRCIFNTSCTVSGTGFLFSREILEENDGWHYHLLTEDIEFTVDQILKGRKVGYCSEAYLYDEQPTEFIQSWNQRKRWAKGFIQIFFKYGKNLCKKMFSSIWFTCFDMIITLFGATLLSIIAGIINITGSIFGILAYNIFDFKTFIFSCLFGYVSMAVLAALVVVTEWKKIYAPSKKKIKHIFTFPFFMFTYVPIAVVAFFSRVSWKPIKHKESKSLKQIRNI